MKFTTFAIVAIYFALVVAYPATYNVETDCKGQWCFNTQTIESSECPCSAYTPRAKLPRTLIGIALERLKP